MTGKRIAALAVGMILLLALSIWAIDGMIHVGDEGEIRTVQDAVRHAALTCFAVEGAYPSELSYLRENYGLSFDEERYHVIYEAFASNQMPQIRVTVRGDGLI